MASRQVSTLVYPCFALVPCIFIDLPLQRQKRPTKNSHNYTKSTVYCVSQLMDLWSLCTNSLGSISGMCSTKEYRINSSFCYIFQLIWVKFSEPCQREGSESNREEKDEIQIIFLNMLCRSFRTFLLAVLPFTYSRGYIYQALQ
jgi:hypothetical protein